MSIILVDSVAAVRAPGVQVGALTARHTWQPAAGAPAAINADPGEDATFPRVRLQGEISGWGALPDGEDRRDLPAGRPLREIPRASLQRGKTLTYSGIIEARDEASLRQTIGALQASLGDASMREGVMLVEPWDGSAAVSYLARVTGLDIPERQPPSRNRPSGGYERTFTLGLRMSRGRIFSVASRSVSGVATVTIANDGTAPTEPTITLTQLRATETIRNATTGAQLVFTGLPVGFAMVLDFDRRTAETSPGVDRRNLLNRTVSDWWDSGQVGLIPGANVIDRPGATAGTLTVAARDAWY